MSNATNISVRRDDGTDIVLVPVSSVAKGETLEIKFRELSTTKPSLACVALTITAETLKSGVIKVTRKLEVPIMAIIPANAVNSDGRTAAPAVDHVETDIRTRYHHPMSTATERGDSLRMANHIDCSANASAGGLLSPVSATVGSYRDVASGYQFPYGDVNLVWPSA